MREGITHTILRGFVAGDRNLWCVYYRSSDK